MKTLRAIACVLFLFVPACALTGETVIEVHGKELQAHVHSSFGPVVFPPSPISGAIRYSSKTGFSIVPEAE